MNAMEAREKFTQGCAHAVLGYLGSAAQYTYAREAWRDPRIRALLLSVLDETGSALIRAYGFEPDAQIAYIADWVRQLDAESLTETCRSLACNPLRQLTADGVLVGAARLCEQEDVTPMALAWAIAAALHYHEASDPEAVALQHLLRTQGRVATLQQVCQIAPGERLGRLIGEALDTAVPARIRSAA